MACPAGSEHLQRGPGNCDLGEASTSTPCRTGKRGSRRCDWPRCWGGEGAGLRRGVDLAPGDGVVTLEAVDGKANGKEERARRAKGTHLQSSCWNFGEGA